MRNKGGNSEVALISSETTFREQSTVIFQIRFNKLSYTCVTVIGSQTPKGMMEHCGVHALAPSVVYLTGLLALIGP